MTGNTATDSTARHAVTGGAAVVIWLLGALAQRKGVEVPDTVLAAAAAAVSGALGGLWRKVIGEDPAK